MSLMWACCAVGIAAMMLGGCANRRVLTGLDVLGKEQFAPLAGCKVGVITNHTGVDAQGRRLIDLLLAAKGVQVQAIFSPEHGLYGLKDEKIEDADDQQTGLKVHSLYGKTRRPTTQSLQDIDTLVYDIQDVGARFYTYPTTMALCMEEAARHHKRFVVLDRPNPITGVRVDGPIADKEHFGFTAYGPTPVMHGMTVGELAQLYNEEYGIGCELTVIRMRGWRREMWWEDTGITWVNPSPNMRSVSEALLYPGVCLLEQTNVSVGRGTEWPFELFGAPWMEEEKLAAMLNELKLPGLRFTAIQFTPTSSKHKGKVCRGVKIDVTQREKVKPVEAGVVMLWAVQKLWPGEFEYGKVERILHSHRVAEQIKSLSDPREAPKLWEAELAAFKKVRQKYLLYP